MAARDEMNSDVSAFEASLSKLAPAEVPDKGMLMFRAGKAAGAKSRRRWQALAAAALCVAGAAGMLNVACPRTRVVERVVYVLRETGPAAAQVPQVPAAVAATAAQQIQAAAPAGPAWKPVEFSEYSYFRLRNQVLEHGLSALPASRAGPSRPQDPRRLMDELLRG